MIAAAHLTALPSATTGVLGVSSDTWTVIASIATTVGVLVALIAVLITTVMNLRSEKLTRTGQQLEQDQAEATAARAEAAARLTESYTRRVVEALESIAHEGLRAEAPRRVTWELVHHGGDTYRLTNTGDDTAHEVTITADPSLHMVSVPEPGPLRSGEAVTFMAAVAMGTRDLTITVSWHDEQGTPHEWRYPLPSRPPRR